MIALVLLCVAAMAAILMLLVRSRQVRRERAVSALLDSADALEARLRIARAEFEAVAGEETDPVAAAMREMLRQRLWLKDQGPAATVAQLDTVRDSIDAARQRIDQQLLQIERARLPQP